MFPPLESGGLAAALRGRFLAWPPAHWSRWECNPRSCGAAQAQGAGSGLTAAAWQPLALKRARVWKQQSPHWVWCRSREESCPSHMHLPLVWLWGWFMLGQLHGSVSPHNVSGPAKGSGNETIWARASTPCKALG